METNSLSKLKEIAAGTITFRSDNPKNQLVPRTVAQRQEEILDSLNEFMECVRYLHTRRTKGTKLGLSSEDDVQDALYLMLRPWVKDLTYEDPSEKSANRFVKRDFFVPSAKAVIEAKYVRDKKHGKDISKELHDDIEMYRQNEACSLIIFFVYDPNSLIPSTESLTRSICVPRTYNGRSIEVRVVVKP